MSARWSEGQLLACWIAAAAMFLLELGLSLALNAVSSLSRVALQRMGSDGNGSRAFMHELREPVSDHRTATVLLRQLCLLGGTLLLILGGLGSGWNAPAISGTALGALIGVLVVEALVARPLALWEPRGALRATAWLMRLSRGLLYPLVALLNVLYLRLDRAEGLVEDGEEAADEEVDALIEVGEREGLLEAAEGEMMRGIADLDETRVREIMTPRIDIVALSEDSTVCEARRKLLEAGHSRLPVYRETIDHVVGVLHARDLFRAWEQGQENEGIGDYLRPVIHVPEHLSAADLLAEMRMKTKIALVVDEYGGVSGLVTLEDVLEEIVGDIRDEHEQDEEELVRQDEDGSWIIQAVAHVEELEDLFDLEFGDREFDTVGGLVVTTCGRVPESGETIELQGLRIEILEADKRRILRVRVRRIPSREEAQAEA